MGVSLSPENIKLAVAIMGVPEREPLIEVIVADLYRERMDFKVAIALDREHAGGWRTQQRALSYRPPGATHLLVLQDDVLLCNGFMSQARAALAAKPTEVVSFYSPRPSIKRAREAGVHWVRQRKFYSSQAVAWPVSLVQPFLDWSARHVRVDWSMGNAAAFSAIKEPNALPNYADDVIISMWRVYHNEWVWLTAPCLVEHVGFDSSRIGFRGVEGGRLRVAAWYEQEPGSIDWNAHAQTPLLDEHGGRHLYKPFYIP